MDGPELSRTALYLAFNLITLLKRYNSEEGFKMQMDLQEGSLQGRWGLELRYRRQLSSRALVKGVTRATACPAVKQHYTPTSATVTQNGHIPFHRSQPKLSCTLVRSRCTQTTQWEESIASQKIYCCRRGKLIACSRGNNSSRLLKWWRVWS